MDVTCHNITVNKVALFIYSYFFRWWRDWQAYVDHDDNNCQNNDNSVGPQYLNGNHLNISSRPGQIDNIDVMFNEMTGDDVELENDTMTAGCNSIFVPQEVWRKLIQW